MKSQAKCEKGETAFRILGIVSSLILVLLPYLPTYPGQAGLVGYDEFMRAATEYEPHGDRMNFGELIVVEYAVIPNFLFLVCFFGRWYRSSLLVSAFYFMKMAIVEISGVYTGETAIVMHIAWACLAACIVSALGASVCAGELKKW